MYVIFGLVFSILLQLIALISAIWLLRYVKSKVGWVLISIALALMGIRRFIELMARLGYEVDEQLLSASNWLGVLVSVIMTASVIFIARILYTLEKTEQDKEESEKRFSTLFHNSSDDIFLADLEGNLLEINNVACSSLGYTADELKMMNFRDLKTLKFIEKVDENIRLIKARGQHTYETEHKTRSGKVQSLEVKSRLIDYQGSKAFLSIARDITERKQLERKILSAVINAEEKERERIAKEIHDDLGPLMSTIKLYVNELESDDLTRSEKKEFFNKANEILNEAISSTRSIANNLTPRVIIDFGLVRAVDSFCKKVNLSQKLNIIYKSGVDERFDPTIELILYRVITELINNSIKHASASKIEIYIERLDDILQLTYMDDGVGFDLDKVLKDDSSGMGIKNIISRLRSVNGTYRIHSKEDVGLLVVIEVKIPQKAIK